MPTQTLCPYTNTLLSSIDYVNEEHVLPIAIGAPAKFYVKASKFENSRMNELIDSPFSNDPLVRFISMSQNVVSRSGPVTANLPATLVASGEAVKAEFSNSGLGLKFVTPVVTDPVTGKVIGVKGFGSAVQEHANRIKRDHDRKNIPLQFGKTIRTSLSNLNISFTNDIFFIQQEMLKTAYLMTIWSFGDSAINSGSGVIYRKGLEVHRFDDLSSIGLIHTNSDIAGISSKKTLGEHTLLTIKIDEKLITHVSLFGVFSATFITPAIDMHANELDGLSIKINVATKAFSQTDAISAIMANEKNQF